MQEEENKNDNNQSKPVTTENKDIDWKNIAEQLPIKKNDQAQKEQRKKLWSQIDYNGNRYVSLAEVEKGLRDVIQNDTLFRAKPAIMRAFQYAKNYTKGTSKYGDDYLEKRDFRIFLVALRQRFEYYVAFKRIDTGEDQRIDFEEFKAAMPEIEKWVGKISNPEEEFKKIDSNGLGQILFDEFCEWSVRKNLDLEDDGEEEDSEK